MNPIFQNLLDRAEKYARKMVFKERKVVPPTWFFFDGKEISKVATPWRNDLERELTPLFLASIMGAVTHYAFVSEAWGATGSEADLNPETYGRPDFVPPRNRRDREEVVLSFATDGKSIKSRCWKLVRDWNELVITLEPKPNDVVSCHGWTTELLGKPEFETEL